MRRLRTSRFAVRDATDSATVSVVIPCFNYARYLPQAVRSAISQEGVAVNVIIVDDASTDDSFDVASRLAEGDGRIRVLRNESNRGAVATFNRGLAAAGGEFLVRLDADDLLTPGSLARSVAVMQSFPRVGLVYGHPLHFEGEKLPPARTDAKEWLIWRGSEWLRARCEDGTNSITSPEVLMRRSVVDRVGGQRDLAHTHDMEMWLRIAAFSDVAYVSGADQAWHREHPASLSMMAEDPLIILQDIRDAFDTLFDGQVGPIDDGARLNAHAHRAVAMEAVDQAQRLIDRGSAGDRVDLLRSFAVACDPKIVGTRKWRAQERAMSATGVARAFFRLRGVFARIRRRLRAQSRLRRWHASGVYEVVDASGGRIDDVEGSR